MWLSLIEIECQRLGIGKRGKLLATPERTKSKDSDGQTKISGPDYPGGRYSVIPLSTILRYLEDRHFGRPVDTVNHLHDKPIEVNATLTLGEGMKVAMEKAEARVRGRAS